MRPRAAHCRALAWCALPLATPAAAHTAGAPPTLATAWSLSPWLLAPLALFALSYAAGLAVLWRRAGMGRGVARSEAGAFAAGLCALFLATVWPLDAYGEWSLAAHMAQHMLLLALVPPLLLAGRPLATIAHALPRVWSRRLHSLGDAPHRHAVAALSLATVAHSGVMWFWHLPPALAAALDHENLHRLMHLTFLLAGLWFWSALWRRIRDPDAGAGAGVIALVVVMMQMGLLGALLTFARRTLYPVYALRAPQIGLEPLADQQLAGLLMWVPSCVPYLAGGLWLMLRGFQRLERRS